MMSKVESLSASRRLRNTPSAERITFVFAPGFDQVEKRLHVSPFMALQLMWKVVSFIPHPKHINDNGYRERAQQHSTHTCPGLLKVDDVSTAKDVNGSSTTQRFCTWREAPGYPWR